MKRDDLRWRLKNAILWNLTSKFVSYLWSYELGEDNRVSGITNDPWCIFPTTRQSLQKLEFQTPSQLSFVRVGNDKRVPAVQMFLMLSTNTSRDRVTLTPLMVNYLMAGALCLNVFYLISDKLNPTSTKNAKSDSLCWCTRTNERMYAY